MNNATIVMTHNLYTDQFKLEVKLQTQKPTVPEFEERQPIDRTLSKRAEYFNFLNDRGLL